ncbi:MAG: hypothetical protein ACYTG0_39170 [Planctomycetota bacterium]
MQELEADSTHSDFIPFITCPTCGFSKVVWLYNADRWLCVNCKHEWKERFEMDYNDQQACIMHLQYEIADKSKKIAELLSGSARQNKRLSAAEAERDQLREACKAMVDAKLKLWKEASMGLKHRSIQHRWLASMAWSHYASAHIVSRVLPWEKLEAAIAKAEGTPHAPSQV